MILDSSAVVAIVLAEPQKPELLQKIYAAGPAGIGAPTLVETFIVLSSRLRGDPASLLEKLLLELDVEVIPFSDEHYRSAATAFLRYGKGRHPASLNFGDCLSYAAVSVAGEPLLFVEADFTLTDLKQA